jgi:hypothetical protein
MEGFSLRRRDKLDLDATWIFRVERVVPRTCGIGVFLIVHGAESSRPDPLDHFINMSPRPSMKGPVIEPDSIPDRTRSFDALLGSEQSGGRCPRTGSSHLPTIVSNFRSFAIRISQRSTSRMPSARSAIRCPNPKRRFFGERLHQFEQPLGRIVPLDQQASGTSSNATIFAHPVCPRKSLRRSS